MIYFGHVKTLSGRRSKNLSGDVKSSIGDVKILSGWGSKNLSGDVRLYWGWSIFSGDGKSFLGKINRG
jgi:hypothetical protein